MLRYLPVIAFLLLAVAAAVVAVSNPQAVELSAFGKVSVQSLSMVMFAQLAAGALAGLSAGLAIFAPKATSLEKSREKLSAWEAQDAKLAVSVQSDKEKQLEAKIATLEAALKQALKKG
jgi:hypothetical protein